MASRRRRRRQRHRNEQLVSRAKRVGVTLERQKRVSLPSAALSVTEFKCESHTCVEYEWDVNEVA